MKTCRTHIRPINVDTIPAVEQSSAREGVCKVTS